MTVNCLKCENLTDEPIKVIHYKSASPFGDDLYSFVDGFKCTWNGESSLNLEDLCKKSCKFNKSGGK